jgi:hypothetical protein
MFPTCFRLFHLPSWADRTIPYQVTGVGGKYEKLAYHHRGYVSNRAHRRLQETIVNSGLVEVVMWKVQLGWVGLKAYHVWFLVK